MKGTKIFLLFGVILLSIAVLLPPAYAKKDKKLVRLQRIMDQMLKQCTDEYEKKTERLDRISDKKDWEPEKHQEEHEKLMDEYDACMDEAGEIERARGIDDEIKQEVLKRARKREAGYDKCRRRGEKKGNKCARMRSEESRLECFDQAAGYLQTCTRNVDGKYPLIPGYE